MCLGPPRRRRGSRPAAGGAGHVPRMGWPMMGRGEGVEGGWRGSESCNAKRPDHSM